MLTMTRRTALRPSRRWRKKAHTAQCQIAPAWRTQRLILWYSSLPLRLPARVTLPAINPFHFDTFPSFSSVFKHSKVHSATDMRIFGLIFALLAAIVLAQDNSNYINVPQGGFAIVAGQPFTITWQNPSSGQVNIRLTQGNNIDASKAGIDLSESTFATTPEPS